MVAVRKDPGPIAQTPLYAMLNTREHARASWVQGGASSSLVWQKQHSAD